MTSCDGPKPSLYIRRLTARQTWQRPTLPRLKTQYHWRWSVSRPSSGWDRVQPLRHSHQVSREVRRLLLVFPCSYAHRGDARSASGPEDPKRKRRPATAASALSRAPAARHYDEHCLMRAIKSIELLVPVSCMHCCTCTPGLSTWWSSTTLEGELVLRWVSRLDAFSGYPVRT